MGFPKNFEWGAATASFQVEGGKESRGESVWDLFCRKDGAIAHGHDGAVACDHYHRFREDIALMKKTGIKTYRFSISWPRILPDGLGKINEEGVLFYNQLIDALLENGIEPYITLFHWDYPLALYRQGGWLNPQSPDWFAKYTKIIMDLFSDRVSHWFTLNENLCFISIGHANGTHAPGLRLSEEDVMVCAHHSLLAHGRAVSVIREYAKKTPSVGFAPVGEVKIPASSAPEDIRAAYDAMFQVCTPHYWGNAIWVDPVMTGYYADGLMDCFKKYHIPVSDDDMRCIGSPIDFLGMNIYVGETVGVNGRTRPIPGFDQTMMGWEITPEALYWGPRFYYERYHKPMYITENGIANLDLVTPDGKVHDPQRAEFLRRYLKCLKQACSEGIDVRGYFQWSLLDNFEWAEGYQKRFGLIYVDYPTGNRILKDSALWYHDMIASNGKFI